jgi:peptide/nickel transport system ATP-binding protein
VSDPLLQVRDLAVSFDTDDGEVRAVDGVSLDVAPGEVLALVGESGSGKSVTALSTIGLLGSANARVRGSVRFDGAELIGASEAELTRVRGAELAMVFQDPLSSLNPVLRVADQIAEQIRAHEPVAKSEARARAIELMRRVGIPQPETRADAFPHELSGGMRQRVMIAMALSCQPRILIADEPTTALDVTIQAQILDLIRELRGETGAGVLLITHDFGVVAELADRVAVMRAGRIVEQGGVEEIFASPQDPYTRALLAAIPRLDDPLPARVARPAGEPVLALDAVEVGFPVRKGLLRREVARVRAVDGVSLAVAPGETVGLVGESGSGKSTLARAAVRLIEPTGGAIGFAGRDITTAGRRELDPLRGELQIVFQDPYGSLNPRKKIRDVVALPLRLRGWSKQAAAERVGELLERVGLEPEHGDRWPHEFSGGQRQRIGIARALALSPRMVVLDEPVSALDVTVQAQIVELLAELQRDLGLAYLFVAHDLSVVRQVSDRVAVMYLGKLMEVAPVQRLYDHPVHPYTAALLAAVPIPDPTRRRNPRQAPPGEPPSATDPPSGCVFRTRCPRATEVCGAQEPPLTAHADGHLAACHNPL